jgi:hypothetical protein
MKRLCAVLLAAAALLSLGAWSARPAKDPWWAAEQFLLRQGVPVIRSDDLQPLAHAPANSLSLMLLGEREHMSATQAQALLAWVYAGGRLLVTVQGFQAPGAGSTSDALLDPLNIRLLDAYASAGGRVIAARSTLTELYLENDQAPLQLGFAPGRHLEDADDLAQSWANSPQGTHMLQLTLGTGTLTVVSDTALWRNQAIGQFDNAWLLWYLNQGRQVVMQYRHAEPGLAQQLAAYPSTLACALLLLSLLAWAGLAQVQHRPAGEPGQAAFTLPRRYRQASREQLLRGLRDDIHQLARLRHPGFGHWPVAAQWQLLARLACTPTTHIAQAMRPHPDERLSGAAFKRQVVQLQAIRNAL